MMMMMMMIIIIIIIIINFFISLHSEFFGPPLHLMVTLSPGHNDITRFRPWSPIAIGNLLDRAKKIQICSDDWHRWRFWSSFRHFRTHIAESFRMSKSSRMMYPTHSREMPSYSAIDLAEIRRSSKISSWIWPIISGVVTVLGLPGWGASEVKKSPRLNWVTQFLTVAYDGACSPNVALRMAWISFYVCEISPTRCNNCVFILRNGFYSTCFGRQSHPSSGAHMLYTATGKLAHCKLTNSICYNNNIKI